MDVGDLINPVFLLLSHSYNDDCKKKYLGRQNITLESIISRFKWNKLQLKQNFEEEIIETFSNTEVYARTNL